jgi:hypothetical protein
MSNVVTGVWKQMAKVAVIGGGPAGLMTSITASRRGNEVHLIEKNGTPGKKLLITGGGRCNLTNLCEIEQFVENISGKREFLYTALYSLPPSSLIKAFEEWGLSTIVENDFRAFPESGRSKDVLDTLKREADKAGVKLIKGRAASIISEDGRITGLIFDNDERMRVDSLILATGGVTYPETGSDGDGYELARSLGHEIVDPRPGIRPWITANRNLKGLQGLTLEKVGIETERRRYSGSLLFTHEGITGPSVFDADLEEGDHIPMKISLDLVPALSREKIGSIIDAARETNPKRKVSNILSVFMSRRLGIRILEILAIPADISVNQLRRDMKRNIIDTLKSLEISVERADDSQGMITVGGIDLKDIDPSTMESKIVSGLFFAGEVMDLQARTGGFNLHIAFSTGFLAGENC